MKFSVLTPSFRQPDWLRLCAASVADQGADAEHLVQEGGPDNGSLDWLKGNPRISARVERDAGMYDALNRGLRRATGDVIGFLNCDEQYLPGALASVEEFFHAHPEVEMVFGDAVIVNAEGEYLFHRKMLPPLLWHTWTCQLSTLTCGTFFRRSVIERRAAFFDLRWRYISDADWMRRLIQERMPMAVLGRFTSVFTHTGRNASTDETTLAELDAFRRTAPPLARALRPLVVAHHRARRWLGGTYAQAPFDFSLFTRAQPERRIARHVARPTARWRW